MPRLTKAKLPKPTAAELDLLRVIWQLGPSTVKDVHQARLREKGSGVLDEVDVDRLAAILAGKAAPSLGE